MMNETVVTVERSVSQPQPPPAQTSVQTGPAPAVGAASSRATPAAAGAAPRTGGGALAWIQFNYQYFLYTIPGYLKIAELVGGGLACWWRM